MRRVCGACQALYVRPPRGDTGHCPSCAATRTANMPTTTQRGLGSKWKRAAREQIKRQPWCSRCGTTSDLTADHIVPRARGGTLADGLDTLCRPCNAAKGAR